MRQCFCKTIQLYPLFLLANTPLPRHPRLLRVVLPFLPRHCLLFPLLCRERGGGGGESDQVSPEADGALHFQGEAGEGGGGAGRRGGGGLHSYKNLVISNMCSSSNSSINDSFPFLGTPKLGWADQVKFEF